jgi:hypothetical protein
MPVRELTLTAVKKTVAPPSLVPALPAGSSAAAARGVREEQLPVRAQTMECGAGVTQTCNMCNKAERHAAP